MDKAASAAVGGTIGVLAGLAGGELYSRATKTRRAPSLGVGAGIGLLVGAGIGALAGKPAQPALPPAPNLARIQGTRIGASGGLAAVDGAIVGFATAKGYGDTLIAAYLTNPLGNNFATYVDPAMGSSGYGFVSTNAGAILSLLTALLQDPLNGPNAAAAALAKQAQVYVDDGWSSLSSLGAHIQSYANDVSTFVAAHDAYNGSPTNAQDDVASIVGNIVGARGLVGQALALSSGPVAIGTTDPTLQAASNTLAQLQNVCDLNASCPTVKAFQQAWNGTTDASVGVPKLNDDGKFGHDSFMAATRILGPVAVPLPCTSYAGSCSNV